MLIDQILMCTVSIFTYECLKIPNLVFKKSLTQDEDNMLTSNVPKN